ncbi:MAG: hypothetical protein KDB23_03980 [Planctomycetales bacterium]|nr:hypothetical protein [Planctomycetales bacterium]
MHDRPAIPFAVTAVSSQLRGQTHLSTAKEAKVAKECDWHSVCEQSLTEMSLDSPTVRDIEFARQARMAVLHVDKEWHQAWH